MDYFKPKFFVAENVGGITTANEGKAFKKILFDLENAGDGYNLTANLYKSEEYGIPQMRHRVIIVGIERSFNLKFRVPAPTTLSKYKTVKEALENPPIPKNAFNNEKTVQSQTVVKRLQHILPGQNVWTADIPDELKLNVRGAKLSQIYRRLHPDRPSYTLTGSGGGGTHGYHWDEPRALTNRERARIQTFQIPLFLKDLKRVFVNKLEWQCPQSCQRLFLLQYLKPLPALNMITPAQILVRIIHYLIE